MKAKVYTCDRCMTSVEIQRRVVIDTDFSPAAWEYGGIWGELPDGWYTFHDDEALTDVCPNCVTPGERADILLEDASRAVMFDRRDGGAA